MWEKIKKRFLDFLLRQSVKNILYVFLLLFTIGISGIISFFYDRGIPAGYEPFGKAQQPKAGGSAECIYDTVCAQDDPDVRYAVL